MVAVRSNYYCYDFSCHGNHHGLEVYMSPQSTMYVLLDSLLDGHYNILMVAMVTL